MSYAIEKTMPLKGRLPIRLHYIPVQALRPSRTEMPLAEIRYSALPVDQSARHPAAHVAMDMLGDSERVELWTSELPVQYGEQDGIRFAYNDEILFGVVNEPSVTDGAHFERRVHDIYLSLFSLLESQAYPHLLRVWNYFPQINADRGGLENYQRFCRARAVAFQERYGDFIHRLPSASAIGTRGDTFVMYFIAAREAGVHRENPRQVSAYNYPPQYGPRSPSFARATLRRFDDEEVFFISGTASIVGHESLHIGDMRAQIEESLRNIDALIESTVRDEASGFNALHDLSHLKVYLRRPEDERIAREIIASRMNRSPEVLYLRGDICRNELLVEIEAFIGHR